MRKASRHISALALILIAAIGSSAQQNSSAAPDQSPSLTVTAFAAGDRVRFTAASSVVQIRLEVYDSAGKKLLDNEVPGANVLDWRLRGAQAEPPKDDVYLCVITVKALSGKITHRIGLVTVENGSATVGSVDASQMTSQQSQAIGPIEENASLIMLIEDENQTATVVAHNGEDGQIARGRGALSFRIGDFFGGKDIEQMRLTAEGNLGIGITHPQVRLDVDGLIRASQGIMFPDGTIQTTAAIVPDTSSKEDVKPKSKLPSLANLSKADRKSGKQGKGDKVSPELFVNEDLTVNGNIIFTFTPQGARDIAMQNNGNGLRFYAAPTLTGTPDGAAIQFWGNNTWFHGQAYIDSGANNQAAVIFRTAPTGGTIAERMRISANGFVGIGTNSPGAPLHVISSGFSDGIRSDNDSYGQAVVGNSPNGSGVAGYSGYGTGVVGSNGSFGVGVLGVNTNSGYGVRGSSGDGTGVFGDSESGNGILGTTAEHNHAGVRGENSGGGHGVEGVSTGSLAGIHAQNTGSGDAIVAIANSGIGVFASSNGGLAGFFAGNVRIASSSGPTLRLENTAGTDGGQIEWRTNGVPMHWNIDQFGLAPDLRFFTEDNSDGSGVVRVTMTGDGRVIARSFESYSDGRLKTNVAPLINALDKLGQVRGVAFEWNEASASLGRTPGQKDIGVIAQEVEAAFPELVSIAGTDGFKVVDYSRLTVVLIEAVKELRAENQALKVRVKALEKAITTK